MKKILSFIIAFAMIISMSSVALAAGGVDCSDPCTDTTHVAAVGGKHYTDIQEAIKDAVPSGTVDLLRDVTVDTWIMFSEKLSIGNGNIITVKMDGLTIEGNGHSLTVNDVESATNGDNLFHTASNLNIRNLTINMNCAGGAIGLESGVIENVVFNNGNCIFPGDGDITVKNCEFNTAAHTIYYENAKDNLKIINNIFNVADGSNVVILRGAETFTGNTVNSGRTVNIASGSPVVTGNNFNNVRLKVYNDAAATISNNKISNLEFNDDTKPAATFTDNTLSEAAETALAGVGAANTVTAPAPKPASGNGIKVKYEGGNSFSTSKSAVPTSVEIDGVAVGFTGDGKLFTVNSIPAGAKWVTVRWNSTSVTTNFTPSGAYAAQVEIPKTGDMPLLWWLF